LVAELTLPDVLDSEGVFRVENAWHPARVFVPVLVTDAWGSKTVDAHENTTATLKETGEVLAVSSADLLAAMKKI